MKPTLLLCLLGIQQTSLIGIKLSKNGNPVRLLYWSGMDMGRDQFYYTEATVQEVRTIRIKIMLAICTCHYDIVNILFSLKSSWSFIIHTKLG